MDQIKAFLKKNMDQIKAFLKKNKEQLYQVLSYVLVAVATACITVAITVGVMTGSNPPSKLSILEQLIADRYVGQLDPVLVGDAAAEAMIEALGDRWSYYISAEEYAAYQENKENAYVGIGITIEKDAQTGAFRVTALTAGGSAAEAGLQAGDVVVAVDGQSALGLDSQALRELVRGEIGTEVTMTVLRGELQQSITVTRKHIRTPVAEATLLEGNVGVIRIHNFNDRCYEDTRACMDQMLEQGAQMLIFDVRFNPGGYAHEMVKVLDDLLPEGQLFRTVSYNGKETVDYSDADFTDLPMAVLVNSNSHSAAEFFAAAMQEYKAAGKLEKKLVIVGEQTSGKGYYQNTFLLPDGSAVALSVGKYYTPEGKSLEGKGLLPDQVVPVDKQTADKIYAGTLAPEDDAQLQAAIGALKQP